MTAAAGRILRLVALGLFAVSALPACVHAVAGPERADAAIARALGFPGCIVSVPLSQEDALERARASGHPHPEALDSWKKLVAMARPTDQLRLVNCLGVRRGDHAGQSFYGLFRDGALVAEMQPMLLN
ncbi:MAG: hypothetical protein ACTHOH_07310 [Lysobacteraceae bacterium]